MPTWTPQDLTSPSFVANMSPANRDQALATMQQNIPQMQAALARNTAELESLQAQTNNGPLSFSAVRDARRAAAAAAADPNVPADVKAELQRAYEEAANARASLTARQDELVRNIQLGEEGISRAELAVSTLQNAGATPNTSPQTQTPPDEKNDPPQEQEGPPPGTSEDGPGEVRDVPNSAGAGEEPGNQPYDEFAGVDEAVAEQKKIAFNTQGQPVLAEDGSVAQGVAINPETGETYYTQEDTAGPSGLTAPETNTRAQATLQDEANFQQKEDWRVRLSLAPESQYLYNLPGNQGILAPLAATDGVIFPYTPSISVNYAASYDPVDVIHSNYKFFQYKNSSVDSITITCDFTAQDTFEANYLLAVIHFFRSVTKMWYGQDQSPKPGTPPPLCYLSGLGAFQFDAHPLAVTAFNYSLPTDVDYIRAGTTTTDAGVNKSPEKNVVNSNVPGNQRSNGLGPGGTVPPPKFKNVPGGTIEPTYVPTKMQISISAVPIISRNDISNRFSLEEYATGKLLQGSKNRRAGIW